MGFETKMLADSVSPDGHRLTTFEVTFPRFILAEFNTHRVFSRNSASSRAIPVTKQIRRVIDDPFIPLEFGTNQPGMQAAAPLEGAERDAAVEQWLTARDEAVQSVLSLIAERHPTGDRDKFLEYLDEVQAHTREGTQPETWLNIHKQIANRLLEPFMWHTVICSATEWDNFFNLRAHSDARPEIRKVAEDMRGAWDPWEPASLDRDEWHLPLIWEEDLEGLAGDRGTLLKVSTGRCARVSYLTHAGKRDHEADVRLHDQLLASAHMSPFEHPARPLSRDELAEDEFCGNFRGWKQYRKLIPNEANALGQLEL